MRKLTLREKSTAQTIHKSTYLPTETVGESFKTFGGKVVCDSKGWRAESRQRKVESRRVEERAEDFMKDETKIEPARYGLTVLPF